MNGRTLRTGVALAVLALSAFATTAAARVKAAGLCAPGADACVVVNTTADVDERDAFLSLREGLLIQGRALSPADLTAAEARQVRAVSALGLRGAVHVNFDPAVFCAGCDRVIELAPPGLGEPDGVSLPPGLGEPDSAPPGHTHPDQIGMGVIDGVEVAAPVILDGSALTATQAGLLLVGRGEVQGMHFRNFAGTAIQIRMAVARGVVIGSNHDGVNDGAEAVTFADNGQDIAYIW